MIEQLDVFAGSLVGYHPKGAIIMKCAKCNKEMIRPDWFSAFGPKSRSLLCKQCACNHEMILTLGPGHGAFGPSRLVCKKCSYETPKHAVRSQTPSSAQSVPPPPAPPSVSGSAAATMGVDTTSSTPPTLTLSREDASEYGFEIDWQNIDLTVEPALRDAHSITVGDIHGNTSTLLIILIKSGIIELNRTDFDIAHNLIKDMYQRPLTWARYEQFYLLLERGATFNLGAQPLLRLLGDDLADRMSNDALTLEVIGLLSRAGYPVIYILGNHDIEFFFGLCAVPGAYPPYNAREEFVMSNLRFLDFVRYEVTTPEQKNRLAANIAAYIQTLRLFDYSLLSFPTSPTHFTIFSHACFQPVDSLILMRAFVPGPEKSYAEFTPEALSELIDRTNTGLRRQFLGILSIWKDDPSHNSLPSPNAIDLLRFLYYRRKLDSVLWFRITGDTAPRMPMLSNRTRTQNVHGHDTTYRVGDVTLDNQVGKDPMYYFGQPQYLRVLVGNSAATASSAAVPSGVVAPPTVPPTPTGAP